MYIQKFLYFISCTFVQYTWLTNASSNSRHGYTITYLSRNCGKILGYHVANHGVITWQTKGLSRCKPLGLILGKLRGISRGNPRGLSRGNPYSYHVAITLLTRVKPRWLSRGNPYGYHVAKHIADTCQWLTMGKS